MHTQGHQVIVGRVKQADGSYARGAVRIENGTVTGVTAGSPDEHALRGAELVDVGESFVLPGAVDAHVHCYSHDGGGIRAGTTSAAAGGVTTIVEMPFDAAAPINTVDRLRAKQQIVADEAVVDVALLGTLAPDGGWRQAEALADAGVVGFKVSLYDTHPVRFPRTTRRLRRPSTGCAGSRRVRGHARTQGRVDADHRAHGRRHVHHRVRPARLGHRRRGADPAAGGSPLPRVLRRR